MNTQKLFLTILIIIIGILAVGGGYYYINSKSNLNIEKKVVQENNIQNPEDILRDYYTNIIDHFNQKNEKDVSLESKFVTNGFIEKQKKDKNEIDEYCTQNNICMPINPFICAQDFPDDASNLDFKQISVNDNTAKFEVYIFQQPIVVYLVKDGEWKLD